MISSQLPSVGLWCCLLVLLNTERWPHLLLGETWRKIRCSYGVKQADWRPVKRDGLKASGIHLSGFVYLILSSPFLSISGSWLHGVFAFLFYFLVSCSVMSNSLQPMDYSPPDSTIHGIFQARILEWFAISFSRGSSYSGIEPWVSRIAGGSLPYEPPRKPYWSTDVFPL